MNTTEARVVIDTNVFITIFKSDGENRWMFDKIINGEWVLCLSNDIFFEYLEILERKISLSVAEKILSFLISSPYVHLVENYFHLNLIEVDKDDNKFCDTAFTSSANFIITNDRHFNVLQSIEFPSITVYTPQEIYKLYFPN
jgi:uncharacterized protein